ncbi:phosphatidylserine/phosphatidylglycerophosphate/cardiolipin synthase family protein [Amycolatopsis japonica]|uniref:phospholipase D-like domain-containing protein n=1 Tax=Amycolatopsis japonica TaxID=208439 RepID=UPI00366C3A2B
MAAVVAITVAGVAGGLAEGVSAAVISENKATAVFDVPGRNNIAPHLESLIKSAKRGSTIKYAAYLFSHKGIADALINAHENNDVTVQILVSGKAPDEAKQQVSAVQDALKGGGDESWIKICEGGARKNSCQGTNAMHNKFLLIDDQEGTDPVVSTGSANLLGTSGGSGSGVAAPSDGYYDSWYTDVGNRGLYSRYEKYFADLENMKQSENYYAENGGPTATGNVKSYFYPRSGDGRPITMLEELGKTDCTKGGDIRVGHFSLKRPEVVDKLIEKARDGCGTAIVVTRIDKSDCQKVARALKYGKLSLRVFHPDNPWYMHNKDVLIDGEYEGSRKKVVFAGSNNLNSLSEYSNDENLLRITDDRIFAEYRANWEFIKNVTSQEGKGVHIRGVADCDKIG